MRPEYVRRVVERLPFDTLIDGSHPSFPVLMYLFRFRDKDGEKSKGRKVKAFVKRRSGRGYVLYAVFEDGSEVDWSWQKALGMRDRRSDVLNAFRYEVMQSVYAVRDGHTLGGLVVTDSGAATERGDVHVHHEGEEFSRILDEFLRMKGLRLEDIELEDIGRGYRLRDRGLAEEWRRFHDARARLMVVSREEHVNLHRGERQKQEKILF